MADILPLSSHHHHHPRLSFDSLHSRPSVDHTHSTDPMDDHDQDQDHDEQAPLHHFDLDSDHDHDQEHDPDHYRHHRNHSNSSSTSNSPNNNNRFSNCTLVNIPSSTHSPSPSTSSSFSSHSSSSSSSFHPSRRSEKKGTSTRTRSRAGHGSHSSPWARFIQSEVGRLMCAIVFFVVVCFGMAFCNQLSDHRWVETGYTKVFLKDRGFDVVPALSDIGPANTFVMTSIVFTAVGMGLLCPTWTTRCIVIRRFLWVIGALSIFRSLTLSVTTLPTPKEDCVPSLKTGFWDMFFVSVQMIPGTVEACTDDIFSGHTVFMVSCAIQWRLYCRNKWVTYLSYLYISIGLYFVVATRLHYTVDVVLAVFITYAAWSVYISMIDVVMEKEYFGIQRNHQKYALFNSPLSADAEDHDHVPVRRSPGHSWMAFKRAQLEYKMNRIRGPGVGYARGEYGRVAFVPIQYNTWLTGVVRWCDGLDLRMRPAPSSASGPSRWEECVIRHRSDRHRVGRRHRHPARQHRHHSKARFIPEESEPEQNHHEMTQVTCSTTTRQSILPL